LKSTKNSGAFSALIALVLLLRAIGPVVFAGSGGSDQLQKYDNFANACDFSIVDMSSCHPQRAITTKNCPIPYYHCALFMGQLVMRNETFHRTNPRIAINQLRYLVTAAEYGSSESS
jgi:hypothetical protein